MRSFAFAAATLMIAGAAQAETITASDIADVYVSEVGHTVETDLGGGRVITESYVDYTLHSTGKARLLWFAISANLPETFAPEPQSGVFHEGWSGKVFTADEWNGTGIFEDAFTLRVDNLLAENVEVLTTGKYGLGTFESLFGADEVATLFWADSWDAASALGAGDHTGFTVWNISAASSYVAGFGEDDGSASSLVVHGEAGEVGSVVDVSAVPLPAAGWLLIGGLGALGLGSRRRG